MSDVTNIDIESLDVSAIDVTPVHRDWQDAWDEKEDEFRYEFYEAREREDIEDTGLECANCTQEIGWDSDSYVKEGDDVRLVPGHWVHIASSLIECAEEDEDDETWKIVLDSDGDPTVAEPEDEDGDEAVGARYLCSWLDADTSDGIEGPMMNYSYELPGYRGDPRELALKLVHLPLCVVEIDDETHLALTGGGMDLFWEICQAYMLAGYLPPIHFGNLPKMADRFNDTKKAVLKACRRSFEVAAGWAQRGMEEIDRTVQWYEEQEAK